MIERLNFDGVVVVGAGLAGYSAALAAAPRRVLLLSPVALNEGCAVDLLRGLQPCETRSGAKLYETPSGSHPMFRILLTTPVCFSIFFWSIMMA